MLSVIGLLSSEIGLDGKNACIAHISFLYFKLYLICYSPANTTMNNDTCKALGKAVLQLCHSVPTFD
jgi:hypothetical protein